MRFSIIDLWKVEYIYLRYLLSWGRKDFGTVTGTEF
jgi:hypothetical protein